MFFSCGAGLNAYADIQLNAPRHANVQYATNPFHFAYLGSIFNSKPSVFNTFLTMSGTSPSLRTHIQ